MHDWFNEARRHAAAIHDVVQLAAGATACAAVLVFVTLSGRSQDDPVVRWLAEVGATTAASEILIPATSFAGIDASHIAIAPPALAQSTGPVNAIAFEHGPSSTTRHTLTHPISSH